MYFSTTDDSIELGKIKNDLTYLHRCFTEMLEEYGEKEIAEILKGEQDAGTDTDPGKLSKAFSLFFQLVTIVEENASVQLRRKLENEHGLSRISGLWARVLKNLKEQGVSQETIAALLPHTEIEPVFTAHPTESKRSTVIDQLRSIYLLMVKRENPIWTESEQNQVTSDIKAALQRLWLTGQVFLQKPSIQDELRNVLHYLQNVFPHVLPILDQRLRDAWEETGFDPQLIAHRSNLPKVSFGDWVGGDRDGHPFVTELVTQDTLLAMRKHALSQVREDLYDLARKISISGFETKIPEKLKSRIDEIVVSLGDPGKNALNRNPEEPWRQFLNLLQLKLPVDASGNPITEFEGDRYYRNEQELLKDFDLLAESLTELNAHRILKSDIEPVARKLETFGFHLASVDIRQNSKFHDTALTQLMKAAGIRNAESFADWPEADRLSFLNEELRTSRPFVRHRRGLGTEADAVLGCYRVLYNHIKQFGTKGIGSLIISMTRSLSDLLVVYVLARESGLLKTTENGTVSVLPVVPLLETIEDLEDGPEILEGFLSHPITKNSLDYHVGENGERSQMVMVGYSDSNKDGGILASLWSLNIAQRKLTETGEKHDVQIRFFHGRGGTISRGAGPTHRFVAGLPGGTNLKYMRLTEQGEVISQKYANRITALYNLELLQAGSVGLTLGVYDETKNESQKRDFRYEILEPIISKLYDSSLESYQALVKSDAFVKFFSQATPIDLIESSSIGSRPARRTGRRTFEDLRAIPWVFSWSQSRFFMTGWYGVGTALEKLKNEDPEAFSKLQEHAIRFMPFRYIITNASSAIALADTEIMEWYAGLVDNQDLAKTYLERITGEFHRTKSMLETLYGHDLRERRPRMYTMIGFRNERLRPLHRLQIRQLEEWREMKNNGDDEAAKKKLPDMLLVLNAIASGLGTTG